MESLFREATENSPKVSLDYKKSFIELEGKSYPENTFEFYENILKWVESYLAEDKQKPTTINIKFSYFNSATSQILFDLFDVISDSQHKKLNISWYYHSEKKSALKDYEDYADEFKELHIKAIAF